MSGLRPRRTAPEDGTVILVFDGFDEACSAHFVQPGWPDHCAGEAKWFTTQGQELPGFAFWMPMPEFPRRPGK